MGENDQLNLSYLCEIFKPDNSLSEQIKKYQQDQKYKEHQIYQFNHHDQIDAVDISKSNNEYQFEINSPRGLLNPYLYRGYPDICLYNKMTELINRLKELQEYQIFKEIFKYDVNGNIKSKNQIEDDYINHLLSKLQKCLKM